MKNVRQSVFTRDHDARQIAWQEYRNCLYGDMRYSQKQAGLAERHSRSERAIEGSRSYALEHEDRYSLACEIDQSIKQARRDGDVDAFEQALKRAEALMR